MDRAKLKTYAPQARRDFIQAMKARASLFGITEKGTTPATIQGDLAFIRGIAHPKVTEALRQCLTKRIETDGFEQVMEAMAHTWFNRFAALRYMELHGYLEHGYRVLSHPEGRVVPEILEQAEYVDLPGLQREQIVDLKLEGKEQELYRLLLVAQCNALHQAMPFLFEAIEDETELLLPDNLLHSDSLISKLVANLDAEDCETVEVLGWLYQFYIAEKKDTVMARKSAVPTDDIPAVTQLFTPHWIVRYLVENSLGRLWLLNRPSSSLREQMPYYIEGEPEADFLKITKPEEIRVLDPAVGSGHMLTYAFDLLFLIYQEEGYAPAEIPGLILRHNLTGVDLCPRAAQLAGLALVFKAREKSRRFFQVGQLVQPNIVELRNVRFADNELRDYIQALGLDGFFDQPMLKLLHQFEEAKTFGSLIQPCLDARGIAYARSTIETNGLGDQLFLRETHLKVLRVLEQAEALTQRYCVVVANPPYMGTKQMASALKVFGQEHYPEAKADIFAMFIAQNLSLVQAQGFTALVTMQSWMFLGSFEVFRKWILAHHRVSTMAHLGPHAFDSIPGEIVQVSAFVIQSRASGSAPGHFLRLISGTNETEKRELMLRAIGNLNDPLRFTATRSDFEAIPSEPLAYWLTPAIREAFRTGKALKSIANPTGGMTTGNNEQFLRLWHEVSIEKIGFRLANSEAAKNSKRKWFPYNKGGEYRKWFGNAYFVVNWQDDGHEIMATGRATPRSRNHYFHRSISYSATGSFFGARYSDEGFIFDAKGASCFASETDQYWVLGFLTTQITSYCLGALNPTVEFQTGDLSKLPLVKNVFGRAFQASVTELVEEAIAIARNDWDNVETSWNFRDLPILRPGLKSPTISVSWQNWEAQTSAAIRRMQQLETENNRIFISAYGLERELQPEVPEAQVTLARAEIRKDVAAFISYAVGCMVGRYSLDEPGLIYANAKNMGFDTTPYSTSPTVVDGIVPVTENVWFTDDAFVHFEAFVKTIWRTETLEENLAWVAESLDPKIDELPRATIRRYFATGLYKDHLQTYKKRPIYWLFTSGKERAFQALVYLHRYNEGTLARMRTEYVIPLQGRISGRIDQLREDIARATSTAHSKKLQKELDTLRKQQVELHTFDEKLRHYADLRISLDLDDGVKVNYGKFGDLLAETKAITGGKDEE